MKVAAPTLTPEIERFWDATREGQLAVPWCIEENRPFWFPRDNCPSCGSFNIDFRPASGLGTVYALSVHARPGPGRTAENGPYVVALVDLDEGVRIMTNIVGCSPSAAQIGMRVALTWKPLEDGRQLYLFEPHHGDDSV